jgi:hypothetical protein
VTALLPRPVALAKLLALEPMTEAELLRVCGWPAPELKAVIRSAAQEKLITWINGGNRRWFYPYGKKICLSR